MRKPAITSGEAHAIAQAELPDCTAPMSAILGRCGKCAGCLERQEANLLELTGMTMGEVRQAVRALKAAGVKPHQGCYGVRTRKGGVLTVRADL